MCGIVRRLTNMSASVFLSKLKRFSHATLNPGVSCQSRVVYMLCQGGKKRSECFHLYIFVYHNCNRKQDNTLRRHKSHKNSDTRTAVKNRYFLKEMCFIHIVGVIIPSTLHHPRRTKVRENCLLRANNVPANSFRRNWKPYLCTESRVGTRVCKHRTLHALKIGI